MLFCDFYKKLQKALGDTEFKKLPPDKGNIYQKIFMLMTSSCNYKISGNYDKDLKLLEDKFIELKEDLEKLTNNLKELKKEAKILVKGEESFVMDEKSLVHLLNHIYRILNLKDRIIIYCYIKNIESLFSRKISYRSFTKHNEIFSVIPDLRENIENFTKNIPLKKLKDKFISSFKEIPDKNLKDKLISSFKEIPDENLSNSNLNEDILNLIRNIKDNIRDKDGFDESCLSRIFNKDVFNKACFNNLNIKFLNCIRDIKAGLRDILNEDEGIDTFKDRFNKTKFKNDLFYNLNNMSRLKTKEFRYQIIARFKSYKDEYAAEASLIEILKKESLNVKDYNGIVDIFTDNFTDILINNYINILTDSLIDSFNKCQTVIDSLLEVIPKESFKVTIDFKDVKDVKDNDSHIYDFIDSRMVNFIVSIIDNLIDNLNKDINNFNKYNYDIPRYSKYLGVYLKDIFPDNSYVSDGLIKEYERYLKFWRKYDDLSKYSTFKKYCLGKDSISKFADEITPNLVNHPYFINVINNLPDEQKKKVYKEFKAEITTIALDDSLDFLGEELSALLKKIIGEADWEELWKKEKNNLLEMVFYPMLATLMCPRIYINSKEEWYKDTYKSFHDCTELRVYLRILEDNTIHIIKNHSHNFLVNLFFFIAEKERLFLGEIFDYLKLKPIPVEYVKTGSIERNFPKYDHGSPLITSIPLSLDANVQDLLGISPNKYVKDFFKYTRHTFNDVKHVLDFKKSIDDKDVYVQINVVPHIELGYMARFFKYYIKNEERILKAANQSRDFWITKRSSKLFTYIKKELKKELETYEIQNFQDFQDFQELKKYFLEKNDCPLIRLWTFSLDELVDLHISFDELVDLHKKN